MTSETPWEVLSVAGRECLAARLPGGGFVVPRVLVGRFEVEALLAPGELTVVLRARDRRTGRPVVVKALQPRAYLPPEGSMRPRAQT